MSPPEENDKAAAAIAAAAAADPDAVQAAVDKAKADADKAEADARSALAKAISDERDTAYKDTVLGRQQRDAEAQKATAEAKKATAAAQRDQVATFIPDLSKVDRGTLEVKGDQPLFASALAHCALDAAAMSLADKAKVALSQLTTGGSLSRATANSRPPCCVYRRRHRPWPAFRGGGQTHRGGFGGKDGAGGPVGPANHAR